MSIKKYFWDLNQEAIDKTAAILKNTEDPKYISRMTTLLSRCDNPKEVFKYVDKKIFANSWPNVRKYWKRTGQAPDFLAWWETIYEEIAKVELKYNPSKTLVDIGRRIKRVRNKKGLRQQDISDKTGIPQADISRIERGYNITLISLIKILKALKLEEFKIKTK